MTRRNFIETTVRVVLLAGLAALSGYAVHKMLKPETCTENPQCKGCGQYNSCTLPQKQKSE